MTVEEQGFIKSICSAPDDDTARLAYADWLDEHVETECPYCRKPEDAVNWVPGHTPNPYSSPYWQPCEYCKGSGVFRDSQRTERAEYIRGHCGLPKKKYTRQHAKTCPRYGLYRVRHHADTRGKDCARCCREVLAARLIDLYCRMLPPWGISEPVFCQWSKGFVEAISCTATYWLKRADVMYWHPSQTVECPLCLKRDKLGSAFRTALHCSQCLNTGRIPRPFVPTAQPIKKVTLTNSPIWLSDTSITNLENSYAWSPGRGPKLGEPWEYCIARQWDRIEFDIE